jgi:hypothetical protein
MQHKLSTTPLGGSLSHLPSMEPSAQSAAPESQVYKKSLLVATATRAGGEIGPSLPNDSNPTVSAAPIRIRERGLEKGLHAHSLIWVGQCQ